MQNFERAYSTKEIAETLGIGDSTLRKWCGSLEKTGYSFAKNDQGYRLFIEHDIIILRQFKKLVKEVNMPLDSASDLVIKRFNEQSFSQGTGVAHLEKVPEGGHSLDVLGELGKEMIERFNQQEEFNQKLLTIIKEQSAALEKQQRYIEERMNKRDELLMQSLRESQETKKILLEAQEEKKHRKGIFKFFSKD